MAAKKNDARRFLPLVLFLAGSVIGWTRPLNTWTWRNAVGEAGAVVSSPDGITWTQHQRATTSDLTGVTFGNGHFVAMALGESGENAGTTFNQAAVLSSVYRAISQ